MIYNRKYPINQTLMKKNKMTCLKKDSKKFKILAYTIFNVLYGKIILNLHIYFIICMDRSTKRKKLHNF